MKDAFAKYIMIKIIFENLVDKDKSVSIHHKKLRSPAMEIYKVHRDIFIRNFK